MEDVEVVIAETRRHNADINRPGAPLTQRQP